MAKGPKLQRYLDDWSQSNAEKVAIAQTVTAIATVCAQLSRIIDEGPLAGDLAEVVGDNADGDAQKALDVRAHDLFVHALRGAPVAVIGSEESEDPVELTPSAPLAVAIDPLDGSSNIDTNVSIGTIFSILPTAAPSDGSAGQGLLQPGRRQLAAGFVIYGPRTALVLTVGQGTHVFSLDRANSAFCLTESDVCIPQGKREYAINASNYRHWDEAVQSYIDDLVSGVEGPRGENFNMRWIASLVAEAFRIFVRGGIFLYPRDQRPGYEKGRLRLVYEANPIAFLVEQAGGGATDGEQTILDITPQDLHQRVPLVFGSLDKVERVTRYHQDPHSIGERSPLFGRRNLFRA